MAPEVAHAATNLSGAKPVNPMDNIAELINSGVSMVNMPYWVWSTLLGPSSLGDDDTPLTSYYENKK
jgi:hypothetical protein